MANLDLQLSELWAKAVLKHRKMKPNPALFIKLKKSALKYRLAPFFLRGGSISLRRNQKGSLVAAVLMMNFEKSQQQGNQILILTMPQDQSSIKWAKKVLERQIPEASQKVICHIEPWQKDLLQVLDQNKIKVRSIRLEGDVDISLRKLRKHYGKRLREPFEKAGLELIPARGSKELESYIRILKSLYSKSPQFGVGVASKEFLSFIKKDMAQAMKRKEKPLWLVLQKGKFIGGVDIIDLGPGLDGKKRAGFGVNLVKSAQGKGFSPAIYEMVFEELKARGFKTYTGSTAQPGVMKLGRIMGRKLQGIEVDRGIAPSFPKGHFKGWI